MKKKIRQILLLLLVGVMLTGTAAVPVPAEETASGESTEESNKVPAITLKKQKFTTKTSAARKSAKSIETGEAIVKMPAKGMGYLKFKAPKKGTYKFSFSDLKKKKGIRGYIYLMSPKAGNKGKLVKKKLKTWGGSAYLLWLGIKDYKHKVYPKAEWPRKVRNTKIKLKKGQEVYLFFSFAAKDTVTVKITKV